MAHLYLSPGTDSFYLDLTAGDCSPVKMAEPADGVYLHVDVAGALVAVEVMDLSRRGGPEGDGPNMGHLHVNPDTDSLHFDVSAGTRSPVNTAAVAEGVILHVDEAGVLVAVELMDLSRRGGLHVHNLDAPPGSPKPAMFEAIERAARDHGEAQRRD